MANSPITHRPRLRPRALRARTKQPIPKRKTAPTPSSYGVDVELRGLDGHARGGGLVDDFVAAVEAGDVG